MNILTVNLVFMTIVFGIAAWLYVFPALNESNRKNILLAILLLHSSRHLGLMFLSSGATYAGLPPQFAYPAALGDLVAAVLAVIAIPAVAKGMRNAHFFVWIFNIWGTLDLILAIALATIYNAVEFMGPAYWIPAFWVPSLLVTHYITFTILLKHWKRSEDTVNANN